MKLGARIVGTLLVLGGLVWILQGVNLLPGSFMTGDPRWAWRGAGAAAIGIAVILLSSRR
jgi:hypothetical protein